MQIISRFRVCFDNSAKDRIDKDQVDQKAGCMLEWARLFLSLQSQKRLFH